MPTYNSARYLRSALGSILAQTYGRLDVVVADDGSTDDTLAIAHSYGAAVRVVSQSTAGPAATRNLGLRSARGELIAFLDPDDLWQPEKLERQVRRFRQRPALGCCICHVQPFWDDPQSDEARHYRNHPRMAPLPGYATTTMLARASTFAAVGDLDERLWFADATDWFMRARDLGVEIELLPDVLVRHRLHTRNLTRRRAAASAEEFVDVVKASLDRRRAASGA